MTIETDVLIIGAGPCGLFQVFELGLLDIRCHVVDSLEVAGGQCAELYPDKPIYDIPAYPVIGAMELIDRLQEQISPFGAEIHLGHEIETVEPIDDARFRIVSHRGLEFIARAVVIAGGVGSFQPRKLRVPGADAFEGDQIHYAVRDPQRFAGRRLAILGGGDSALDWVNSLAPAAHSTVLIHRRPEYRAQDHSVNQMRDKAAAGQVTELRGQPTALTRLDDGTLALTIVTPERTETLVEVDDILVFWGLSPKLGPIANWGLNQDGNQIAVDTAAFQTSTSGIYAVGDINTYPGKKKLILSGFHEAALAAFDIKARLNPEKKVHLQYTTTSPIMHKRLGLK